MNNLSISAALVLIPLSMPAYGQGQLLDASSIQRESFGTNVAIDGDFAVVTGAIARHPTINSDVPVISVYHYNGTTWEYDQTLFSEDPFSRDMLAGQVDIEGSLIVAGAPGVGSGSVVFFEDDGSDWVEQGQIFHTSTTSGFDPNFGSYVALYDDVLVVPNTRERAASGNLDFLPQSTYIFRNNGTQWVPEDTLSVSTGDLGTSFGASSAAAEDLIVVGDPLYSAGPSLTREGAAYVFSYTGSSWDETQILSAGSFGDPNDRLGTAVATDGNTIVVGAVRDTVGSVESAGGAYVYQLQGGSWVNTQRLVASDGEQQDYFGQTLAVEGNHMIVGAPNDFRPNFINAGGYVYYFRYNGAQWIEVAKLALPNAETDDRFGWSVDIDGDWAIVGAPGRTPVTTFEGEAYVFDLTDLTSTGVDHVLPNFILDASLYPNPFNGDPTVSFTLSEPQNVQLDIYDILGRHISRIEDAFLTSGAHERQWERGNAPAGTYFFRLTAGTTTSVVTGILTTR